MRDFQKSRVYAFEDKCISPFDETVISLVVAQEIVNFIWTNEDRDCPPKVSQNKRYKTKTATGDRFKIQIDREDIKQWILIHEIAHSLNRKLDEEGDEIPCDRHGPKFMLTYLTLLDKYLNMNMLMLLAMCKHNNIKVSGIIS